ncbi:MAG: endonuclease [Flavobacteriaceae bacterium]|nr:endonuclease [Flavobacteriaceae bacterium]
MKKIILFILVSLPCLLFAQIPSYYNDVNLNLTGISLKNELATKIISTHTKNLSYREVWSSSKITDLDPSNSANVILIYGYDDTDGNHVTDRTRSKNSNGGGVSDWNREHVYPKSLGTPNLRTSGPGSDAHHLRPASVTFNGQRGSEKFATGSGYAGNSSGGWYPGDEWKGDVARMMMYMYLRYGNRCLPTGVGIGSSSSTPDAMISLFLDWNAQDPVSQFETNRNDYHGNASNTYAQGNRNPFIDNPAFATQIWGGLQAEDLFDGNGGGNDGGGNDGGSGTNDCVAADLTLSLTFDNYPEETAWTLKNTSGTTITSGSYSTSNPDGSTITKTINNLSSGDYVFTITDTYGDGICCSYGNGSYTLSSSQGVIVTGGNFNSSEVTNFCVDANKSQGSNNNLLNDITIYPNPVKSILNIDTKNKQIESIVIFSVVGKLIMHVSDIEKNYIDVSKLATGTYYIKFVSNDTMVTRKFIKK